jgi:hypothetical protein
MAKTIAFSDGDPRDFDETRRLLYMALLAPRTKKYNLAGTLVNALRHHHAVDDLSVQEITDYVIAVLESRDGEPPGIAELDGRRWLQEQVDRITTELGD